METDILRELLILDEKRSYAAAADALFISSSTLSRHIVALEGRLGVTLFHRTPRCVMATQHGKLLLSYARQITRLEDEYLDALDREKQREGGALQIGAAFPPSSYGIARQLALFLRENRELSLLIRQEEGEALPDMLREGKVAFAVLEEAGPTLEDGLGRMTVAVDQLAAVLPREHPLAQAKSVRLSQLRGESFAPLPARPLARRLAMEAFHRAGYTPDRTEPEAVGLNAADLVEQGFGVAVEQEESMGENPGVAAVPLDPPERIWINLVWHPDRLTAAGKALIAHFRDAARGPRHE